jgi:hypothetical protein
MMTWMVEEYNDQYAWLNLRLIGMPMLENLAEVADRTLLIHYESWILGFPYPPTTGARQMIEFIDSP